MSEIEHDFSQSMGSGSWQTFIRFYIHNYDGHRRVHESITAMADNLQDRIASIGGTLPRPKARFWARKYIWSMLANSYRGFCSERMAIELVGAHLGAPYTTVTDESAGIDGVVDGTTVQVKPDTHLGMDLNDHNAEYLIRYAVDGDEFVFTVPDGLCSYHNN
jgi:hypothetical protein